MDEMVDKTLQAIDTIYRDGGDREETLAMLERIKVRVDGLIEDLL